MSFKKLIPLIVLSLFVFGAFSVSAEGQLMVDSLYSKSGFPSVFVDFGLLFLEAVVSVLSAVLFFEISGFPLLVLWLVAGGLFFTFKLGFVNIKLFRHAIDVVRGKYSSKDDPGEVTHFQALVAAVSATVGLGNIAGVAIAVSMGGPGAVFWMMVAGFLGMSTKFAEVTLGQKYRKIDANGKVSGGAFYYLSEGLAEMNYPRLGKVLAVVFAICCIGGSFGGGNLFQANQTVTIMTDSFDVLTNMDWIISLVIAVAVGTVLIGGIKRIAIVAEAVVPFMAFIYIGASVVVLVVNADKVPAAIAFIFQDAFSGVALGGGLVGALISGFRRAAFSNEAGLGSAPIAHAAAKTKEPVREGVVALLEPFLDTMIICFISGIVITVTGVYEGNVDGAVSGVLLTSSAFATVADWFPKVLSVAVALFAFSTMITWSYYGERSWNYLFHGKGVGIYHIIFCCVAFLGGVVSDIALVVDFSDLLTLSMAFPNLIGLYFLSGHVKTELDIYKTKLKDGDFRLSVH